MHKSVILPIGFILLTNLIAASCTTTEDTQEYKVYAAITGENSPRLVLDYTTVYGLEQDLSEELEYVAANMPELPQELFDDFEAKNKESHKLDATKLGSNCELLSDLEWQEMLKGGPGAFYEYGGILAFSRVGFDHEKTQALVYVDHRTDGLTGMGYYALLAVEGKEWIIQQEVLLWVS